MTQFLYWLCLFPSCCFVSESMCQQGLPNSFLGQRSMESIEDQDLAKSKHLMQSLDQFQLPQYVDPKEKQPVQPLGVQGTMDKEVGQPVLLVSHMSPKEKATPPSLECQPQVPFLKLLLECGEKLGIREQSNKPIQDTSQPPDLQPGMKLAFREYVYYLIEVYSILKLQ